MKGIRRPAPPRHASTSAIGYGLAAGWPGRAAAVGGWGRTGPGMAPGDRQVRTPAPRFRWRGSDAAVPMPGSLGHDGFPAHGLNRRHRPGSHRYFCYRSSKPILLRGRDGTHCSTVKPCGWQAAYYGPVHSRLELPGGARPGPGGWRALRRRGGALRVPARQGTATALAWRRRRYNGNVGATATLVQRQRWCNGNVGATGRPARRRRWHGAAAMPLPANN